MQFYFYILFSQQLNKYYVGHTGETVESRLQKHLTDHSGFTSKAKDWMISHSEIYGSKSEAYQRELEVKSWKSSKRIAMLIQSIPPKAGGS